MAATSVKPVASDDRRGVERLPIGRDSTVRNLNDGVPHEAIVTDLSCDGCGLKAAVELKPGMTISLGLPGVGTRVATVLRRDGDHHGCTFDPPITREELSLAFTGPTVVHAPLDRQLTPAFAPPALRKWHPAERTLVILSSSVLLWAVIGYAVLD